MLILILEFVEGFKKYNYIHTRISFASNPNTNGIIQFLHSTTLKTCTVSENYHAPFNLNFFKFEILGSTFPFCRKFLKFLILNEILIVMNLSATFAFFYKLLKYLMC